MYVIMSKHKEYVVKLEEIQVNGCRVPQVTKNIDKAYMFDNRDYAKGCLELSGLGFLGYKVVKVK